MDQSDIIAEVASSSRQILEAKGMFTKQLFHSLGL
jgi:hypothetical protein